MPSSPHLVYAHTHRALHCMPEEHAGPYQTVALPDGFITSMSMSPTDFRISSKTVATDVCFLSIGLPCWQTQTFIFSTSFWGDVRVLFPICAYSWNMWVSSVYTFTGEHAVSDIMHICMCVCVYMCIYAYVCMHTVDVCKYCVWSSVNACTNMRACMKAYVGMCADTSVYVFLRTTWCKLSTNTHYYMHICVQIRNVYMNACMHMHMHTYINIHMHVYMYTCMHVLQSLHTRTHTYTPFIHRHTYIHIRSCTWA